MTPTLERHHSPLTAMFPRFEATAAAGHRLSAAQLAAWRRDGFVAGLDVLSAHQVEALRDRLRHITENLDRYRDRLYEVEAAWDARPDLVVFHALGAWRVDELFHDLLFHPAITVPSAQLLGVDRVRFWHDQVFAKPPRHPGVVPWHQDWAYWRRTAPACHLTVNIVLDDADEESGCLHVIPGSHRGPLYERVDFGGPMDALFGEDGLPGQPRPVALHLRAGQASIHHSHTIHGSYANRSDRPRRAVVVNYMGPHVRVADDRAPLLTGAPPLALGARVAGEFFPIVLTLPTAE